MSRPLTRRQILAAFPRLSAIAGIGCLWPESVPARSGTGARSIDELADALRDVSRGRAFEIAAEAVRSGTNLETFLGAVLRIGVEDVRPRPHGILHTVMMVHSTFVLANGANLQEAWLAALWNLDDLKTAQRRDRDEDGDWTMPARPASKASTPERARSELVAAMKAWDPDRADRAVVAMLPHVDHDALFEIIWPFAVRCRAFIGHKVIYAAQLERALRRVPDRHAEPAARSLVRTLLVDRDTEAWEANLERAGDELGNAGRRRDPGRARELYRRLRGADAPTSASTTLDALGDGLTVDDVWNALRLVASEVFHRRSGRRSNTGRNALLPVHALTVVNALGHVARTTEDARLSRLCLLQAVSWLPPMRDWLVESTGLATDGPPFAALGHDQSDIPTDIDSVIESGSPDLVCAYLSQRAAGTAAYVDRIRTSLLRTAREHHQHKYAAAMIEESTLCHPDLRPLILAPAVDYLANPADRTSELHERSLRTVERAGIR